MKITSVDIFLLRHVGEEFSPFPFRPAVCRVNTDEGICGYGEAGISVGTGENAWPICSRTSLSWSWGRTP